MPFLQKAILLSYDPPPITHAFLQLRRKKPLERITVKELAELAEISKATFYLHYQDIYDLSEQLQNEVIQSILNSLADPEACLTDNRAFTEQLFYAFHAQQSLVETLFSGMHSQVLTRRIEKELICFLKKRQPNMDRRTEMLLTYNIQGGHAVYQAYHQVCSLEELIDLVSTASTRTME